MHTNSIGSIWSGSSLVWGTWRGSGQTAQALSPLDGSVVQIVNLLNAEELNNLVASGEGAMPFSVEELNAFCARLGVALRELREPLLDAIQWETAFILADCEEMVEGALTYVAEYSDALQSAPIAASAALIYQQAEQTRAIQLATAPWGTIAVILPQNAFLFLALTCLLNALASGNQVILRAPLHSARSAALLARAIEKAGGGDRVSVVQVGAKELTTALYASPRPCLLHYMGSSRHAPRIIAETFAHGKGCLIDGEGNGWMWVDRDVDVERTADLLIASALRYNGQTCTSTNGVLIHPDVYPQVREYLLARWDRAKAGDPRYAGVKVGPLFDTAQAAWCRDRALTSGGAVLRGGLQEGNLLHPTLVENPYPDSELVREGIFGPVLWIAAATRNSSPGCGGTTITLSQQAFAQRSRTYPGGRLA